MYVAFLRAVNVGGRTVKMERAKTLFEALGFSDVQPFLASGNILFASEKLNDEEMEARIEQTLASEFGFDIPTFIRSESELRALAVAQPFPPAALQGDIVTYVSFLKKAPETKGVQRLAALEDGTMSFVVDGAHAHWLRRRDKGDSEITNAHLERALGVAATRRNMNTIQRLLKKL
jgi:uncharacterized protein (DUF1697 family)